MPPTSKTQGFIDFIRAKIATGEWPPGHKLPSRQDLMREHKLSITVVRDAQNYLRAVGELTSIPGVGYFVPDEDPLVADHPPGSAPDHPRE